MRIDCEGAPRDLGLDQGRAIGEGVDAELARILRRSRGAQRAGDPARDVGRHFPHLAERMAGLASGARVSRSALALALSRAASEPAFLFRPARAVGVAPGLAPRPLLGGRFDLSADRCSVPIVRSSRPQGGFDSLELTLPWLASALGGVNAEGLAVLLAPSEVAVPEDGATVAEARCMAPALLFVQQCLERFDRVGTALDWCLSRPAGGRAALFFADAHGALAGVACDGDRRHVLAPSQPGLLWSAPAAPDAALGDALCADPSALPSLLSDPTERGGPAALAHRAYLWLDPGERRLAVVLDPEGLGPARVERFDLGADPAAPPTG